MPDLYAPASSQELGEVIAAAAAKGSRLGLRAGGSKSGIGAPAPGVPTLDMRGFRGVVDYDPAELVLTVRAGTPLAEVEALVAAEGQGLAFDPWDHGRLFGQAVGAATIGGVIAAGVAGSRRVSAGASRDHLLGFEAVNGRGEPFRAGSKVVKNVTGFDLPKLVTGSWGRLVALTQLTLKVLPEPEMRETLLLRGLAPAAAVAAMARALGSPAGVVAAAHLPRWREGPATFLRIDGFDKTLPARRATLSAALADVGTLEILGDAEAAPLWDGIRDAAVLPVEPPLWRIVLAPRQAPAFIEALGEAEWLLDWGGALAWAATPADATRVREAAVAAGGHAMLVRADAATRRAVCAFHPQAPGVETLQRNLRRAFDPQQVFETGRF